VLRAASRALVLALLVPVVPLVAASPAAAAPVDGPPVRSYVALGDSYAAGPLIPLPTGRPAGCLRSTRNYPSMVAETLGVPDFRDASCSGATTAELAAEQATQLGTNPPQFDRLDPDVELVSLTIGGNDIGFAEIIDECAKRSPTKPFGAACKEFYTAGGQDQLAARIDAAAPKVAASLAAIAGRAPDAAVLLVGYPAILPDSGPGCFPVVPYSGGDVAFLRETEKRLNAMLADEAERAGATYVDTYAPTVGPGSCRCLVTCRR
jgi:lysophospholipase L1-like esterase